MITDHDRWLASSLAKVGPLPPGDYIVKANGTVIAKDVIDMREEQVRRLYARRRMCWLWAPLAALAIAVLAFQLSTFDPSWPVVWVSILACLPLLAEGDIRV